MDRIITYADKLILYPIIGGHMVSVYFVSNIFGKIISLLIIPINNVMLSYIAKLDKKSNKLFSDTLFFTGTISVIGYLGCLFVSEPMLKILYPQYAIEAMQYIKITSLSGILQILVSSLSPFLLKFYGKDWQVKINSITLACYFLISIITYLEFGFRGFCVGVVITNIIKIVIMISVFYFKNDKVD